MSRLMTPGSTTAIRLSGSTSRMRFRREVTTTTPPSQGMAPPERPVPAPRAAPGAPRRRGGRPTPPALVAAGDSPHFRDLLGAVGQDHRLRQAALDRGVVLVDQEVFGGVEDPFSAHGPLQLSKEVRHDIRVSDSPAVVYWTFDIRARVGIRKDEGEKGTW